EVVAEVPAAILENAVERGVGDAVRDLHAPDKSGQDDFIGPGLLELLLGGGVFRTGDDAQVGAHVPRGKRDEDVDHVVGQDGGEDDGPLDVGLGEGAFVAGV